MSINKKCPKCGSSRVQLTDQTKRHGCLWLFLFGVYYVAWTFIKWIIGLLVLLLYDWWVAIIQACFGKQHIWRCRYWFTGVTRTFYCHDCGYNFRA